MCNNFLGKENIVELKKYMKKYAKNQIVNLLFNC